MKLIKLTEENADKANGYFLQLPAEVRSSFATLKVVPPNKVASSLCEALNLGKKIIIDLPKIWVSSTRYG